MRTHWIALNVTGDSRCNLTFTALDLNKNKKKITGNKNIITNFYRIQACDLVICEYFWIGFIDFMLNGRSSLGCNNLFSPNEYKKNDRIMVKYFQ